MTKTLALGLLATAALAVCGGSASAQVIVYGGSGHRGGAVLMPSYGYGGGYGGYSQPSYGYGGYSRSNYGYGGGYSQPSYGGGYRHPSYGAGHFDYVPAHFDRHRGHLDYHPGHYHYHAPGTRTPRH